ncbi:hypothetical protein D1007_49014 [Hordeum vulgare]|nr:hypothetical protein D1007_49014 [Hordeum vulgare]
MAGRSFAALFQDSQGADEEEDFFGDGSQIGDSTNDNPTMANLGVAALGNVPKDNNEHMLRAHILAKQQSRLTIKVRKEQRIVVHRLVGCLSPLEVDWEDAEDSSYTSDSEQIQLELYFAFDRYLKSDHGDDRKGKRKRKKG